MKQLSLRTIKNIAENLYSSVTMKLGKRNLPIAVSMSLWAVVTTLKYANLQEFTSYPNWKAKLLKMTLGFIVMIVSCF